MKFSTFLTGVGLVGVAAAGTTRHARGHAHRQAHEQARDEALAERQVVVEAETKYVVCHDPHGQVVKCSKVPAGYTEVGAEPAIDIKATAGNVQAANVPDQTNQDEQRKKEDERKAEEARKKEEESKQTAAPAELTGAGGPRAGSIGGVTYSPYGSACRSVDNIRKDWAPFPGKYSTVRLYGTDCDQVARGMTVAKELNLQLMLGVFYISKHAEQAQTLIDGVNGNWAYVHSVNVGNEPVFGGKVSVGEVIAAIGTVRGMLRAAGFKGPVLTVESMHIVEAHPELCEASDICGVNMHPWFGNGQISASMAGKFMEDKVAALKKVTSKDIYVTESGWPNAGDPNGVAIPSKEQQDIAIGGIRAAFKNSRDRLFLFSAYDEPWKDGNEIERHWGIGGSRPSGN